MTSFYRLTTPAGDTFEAKIEYEPGPQVYSTRESPEVGEWKPDPKLAAADLIMPEQGPLYDWDVERINTQRP